MPFLLVEIELPSPLVKVEELTLPIEQLLETLGLFLQSRALQLCSPALGLYSAGRPAGAPPYSAGRMQCRQLTLHTPHPWLAMNKEPYGSWALGRCWTRSGLPRLTGQVLPVLVACIATVRQSTYYLLYSLAQLP